ncbi:hypothetical protein PENTCL1PPCAC_12861, partial [Pristionchus entomophagus]
SHSRTSASGMTYLEKEGIIHRDLAARNILIASTDDSVSAIKISDFGFSRSLEGDKNHYSTYKDNFPREWTAPEAFALGNANNPSKVGKPEQKSDVWSYGVVLWELYSNGKDPIAEYSGEIMGEYNRQSLYDLLTNAPCFRLRQ